MCDSKIRHGRLHKLCHEIWIGTKIWAGIRFDSARKETPNAIKLVWNEARFPVIKLLADALIFIFAALSVAICLITTYELIALCNLLFENNETLVKTICFFGEVILSLYLVYSNPKP